MIKLNLKGGKQLDRNKEKFQNIWKIILTEHFKKRGKILGMIGLGCNPGERKRSSILFQRGEKHIYKELGRIKSGFYPRHLKDRQRNENKVFSLFMFLV